MALLAHGPELAIVRIITRVTNPTGLVQLDTLCRRLAVTVIAVHIIMGAIESKIGILVMIERPQIPAIGVMTLLTVRAETCLVHIVILVTVQALMARRIKAAASMAVITGGHRMQAGQWKRTHVMIESHLRIPVDGTVATRALLAGLALMRVIGLMAGVTAGGRFCSVQIPLVTTDAGRLFMFTRQFILGITIMIETDAIPARHTMT